jgi:mono/diheme cytochrome c family protein
MTHHHSFSGSFSGSFSRYMFGVLFIAGALMATSAHAQVIDEFSGQETYMRYCAACHGESGMGDGPVAGGLPITVPDLTLLQQRSGDAFQEELLRKIIDGREVVIVHGTRYMPVWGYEFWVEEGGDEEARQRVDIIVDNLVEYLRSIQR